MMKIFFVMLLSVVACVMAAELKIEKTFVPETCDRKTKKGDNLSMHYTGSIDESSETGVKGKVFDSSRNRGQPFDFVLGTGQVIAGWDQGLLDMCVGEKRVLTIPPNLGYGSRGAGNDIPGGATLKFDVECVKIGVPPPQPNIFKEIDANSDGQITKEEMQAWFTNVRNAQMPAELFAQEDKNGDGVVSWDEFTGPKGTKDEF